MMYLSATADIPVLRQLMRRKKTDRFCCWKAEAVSAVDVRTLNYFLQSLGWRPFLGAGMPYDGEAMKVLLETMLREVGAEILYYTDIVDVIKEGDTVKGAVIHNKDGLQAVYGTCVIDATGDGDVCTAAGCAYQLGDEEGGLVASIAA
ncbi:MAG: FAD-dependent oxidoreductase [Ruminococcaceae bacterium]|nr:FAD-dependent oxidoreductase [Oscillospiraceae bacterium]